MKNLSIVLMSAVLMIACSNKDKMPPEIDFVSDMSGEIVSESDLASNGCYFENAQKSLAKTIQCENANEILAIYRQKLSIYRYEKQAHLALLSKSVRTPSGKIINDPTLSSLSEKWKAAYRTVFSPAVGQLHTVSWSQFTKIGGTDAFSITLSSMLEALVHTGVQVQIDDSNHVAINVDYADADSLKNFKKRVVECAADLDNAFADKSVHLDAAKSLMESISAAAGHL